MGVLKNLFAVLLITTFFLGSMLINLVQMFLYFTLRRIDIHWYRTVNYYLNYSSWSQVVALIEWWSGSTCSIYADRDTWDHFGKEHAIAVMNHKYEIDWALAWLVVDKFGILGNLKSFAKRSLKKVPIIGWSSAFGENIFLDRDWEKDSLALPAKLDRILDYRNPKCTMLLFAEGTRFTPEKHAVSVEFAKQRNYPVLKHHLLPRPKGFNLCIKYLKGKTDAVYNIQTAVTKGSAKPSVLSIFMGKPVQGHVFLQRILLDDIPTQDDKLCTEWLYNLYKQKDELMDGFEKNGFFPGEHRCCNRRLSGLLNLTGWFLALGGPILYFLTKTLLFGSVYQISIAATIAACLGAGIYAMLRASNSQKGSSYGKASSSGTTQAKKEASPRSTESTVEENKS